MIKFENVGKRCWNIILNDEKIRLEMIFSPTVNKFNIITDFVEDLSKFYGKKFDDWFKWFLEITSLNDIELACDQIQNFCDSYIESLQINWSKYIDRSKIKKTSIVFLEEDLEKLIKMSSYLKIFSVRSQSKNLNLGSRLNRFVFNRFLNDEQIVNKIFDLCRSKVFSYYMSDSFMWSYLKATLNKDIGTFAMEIFNHIMNYIIILCKNDMNPVVFLVTVVDSSVGFIFKGIYRNTFIFESTSDSVDYQNLTTNTLRTCIARDAILRLRSVSYNYAIEKIRENCGMFNLDCSEQEGKLTDRLFSIQYISPVSDYVLLPLLSKILEIPYSVLKSEIKPGSSALIGLYLKHVTNRIFQGRFKNLFDLLSLFAVSDAPKMSSFRIKNLDVLLNNLHSFYGVRAIEYPASIISQIVGRIYRVSYCDILTGKPVKVFLNIEKDSITFFSKLFSGNLDFDTIRQKLLKDI